MGRDADGGGVRDETTGERKNLAVVMPKCWNLASSVHDIRTYGADVETCADAMCQSWIAIENVRVMVLDSWRDFCEIRRLQCYCYGTMLVLSSSPLRFDKLDTTSYDVREPWGLLPLPLCLCEPTEHMSNDLVFALKFFFFLAR